MMTNDAPGEADEPNSRNTSGGINLDSYDAGQQRHQDSDDRIYARGATPYWEAGWRAPLPFPPGRKAPPPKGYTGHEGRWPDDDQIATWAREERRLS